MCVNIFKYSSTLNFYKFSKSFSRTLSNFSIEDKGVVINSIEFIFGPYTSLTNIHTQKKLGLGICPYPIPKPKIVFDTRKKCVF